MFAIAGQPIKSANLAAYEECLAIRRRLAEVDPRNIQWQHDQALILDQIGNEYRNAGMKRQAIEAYEGSIVVWRHLANIDPQNSQRQLDVAISLNKLGDMKFDGADSFGALTSYERSVAVWRRLFTSDPNDTRWQFKVAEALEKIGDIKFLAGDNKGAFASYEEMLSVDRRLVEIDGSNTEWQWNLSLSLERIGDVKIALGDGMSALAAYEESLAIRRALVELNESKTQWQESVSLTIEKINDLKCSNEETCAAEDQENASWSKPGLPESSATVSSGHEGARTDLLFLGLSAATGLRWLRDRKEASALLSRLSKRSRSAVRSLREMMRLTLERLLPRPSSYRNRESARVPTESELVESDSGCVLIQREVGTSPVESEPSNTTATAMRMVFTSAFSKTDDPMTMNQSAVKKHRRGRRGRRKRRGDIQPSSARKNLQPSSARKHLD
jgi:tetratricopeptide (TPR) repeat protein